MHQRVGRASLVVELAWRTTCGGERLVPWSPECSGQWRPKSKGLAATLQVAQSTTAGLWRGRPVLNGDGFFPRGVEITAVWQWQVPHFCAPLVFWLFWMGLSKVQCAVQRPPSRCWLGCDGLARLPETTTFSTRSSTFATSMRWAVSWIKPSRLVESSHPHLQPSFYLLWGASRERCSVWFLLKLAYPFLWCP